MLAASLLSSSANVTPVVRLATERRKGANRPAWQAVPDVDRPRQPRQGQQDVRVVQVMRSALKKHCALSA